MSLIVVEEWSNSFSNMHFLFP